MMSVMPQKLRRLLPLYKNLYLQRMEPSMDQGKQDTYETDSAMDYCCRLLLVALVIIIALCANYLLSMILEMIHKYILQTIIAGTDQEEQDDEQTNLALNLMFGITNLTCTALIVWEVDSRVRAVMGMNPS